MSEPDPMLLIEAFAREGNFTTPKAIEKIKQEHAERVARMPMWTCNPSGNQNNSLSGSSSQSQKIDLDGEEWARFQALVCDIGGPF